MSKRRWITDQIEREQSEDKPMPEPSEPMRIETENIFDPELLKRPDPNLLEEMDSFLDNPMNMVMKVLTNYLDSFKPRIPEPIKSEHKVKIFRLPALAKPKEIASIENAIETILNDGYCCHIPTVCNDFLIMDFSRRKETEENGADV